MRYLPSETLIEIAQGHRQIRALLGIVENDVACMVVNASENGHMPIALGSLPPEHNGAVPIELNRPGFRGGRLV